MRFGLATAMLILSRSHKFRVSGTGFVKLTWAASLGTVTAASMNTDGKCAVEFRSAWESMRFWVRRHSIRAELSSEWNSILPEIISLSVFNFSLDGRIVCDSIWWWLYASKILILAIANCRFLSDKGRICIREINRFGQLSCSGFGFYGPRKRFHAFRWSFAAWKRVGSIP